MSSETPPPMTSIQARIAALNLNQVGRNNNEPAPPRPKPSSISSTSSGRRAPPPPPSDHQSNLSPQIETLESSSRPKLPNRPSSIYSAASNISCDSIPPSLPNRRPSGATSIRSSTKLEEAPLLPTRRNLDSQITSSSNHKSTSGPIYSLAKRSSRESLNSVSTTASSYKPPSVRAPEWNGPTGSAPALPARKKKESQLNQPLPGKLLNGDEEKMPKLPLRRPTKPERQITEENSPVLPSRQSKTSAHAAQENIPTLPSRPLMPNRPSRNNDNIGDAPVLPSRPPLVSDTPPPIPHFSKPPIPHATRPQMTASSAIAPGVVKKTASTNRKKVNDDCLVCRDYSEPDAHAANFPRERLDRGADPIWLGRQLGAPFGNDSIDKARAIFMWLHLNIEYDVKAFFGNNVRHMTPSDVLRGGKAVCDGYSGLFNELCKGAGVESVRVGGHGKGIGYAASPGHVPPKNPSGHAWNAFRLPSRDWKLIDACWGAGNVTAGTQSYSKFFNPAQFTMSNDDFAMRHFPEDPRQFYLDHTYTWEEYILRDADIPQTWDSWEAKHGWSEYSLEPRSKTISVRDGDDSVRFMFNRICTHFDPVQMGMGEPYLPFLIMRKADGSEEFLPMNTDGYYYYSDFYRNDIGKPGEEVKLVILDKLNGNDSRGLTPQKFWEWKNAPGGKGWSFQFLAAWKLV